MASFKVSILEKDGEEFLGPTEYDSDKMLAELGFEKDGATLDAGWSCLDLDTSVKVKRSRLAVASKFEQHNGYIEHDGYITGEG